MAKKDIAKIWEDKFGMRPDDIPLADLVKYVGQTKNPHRHRHKDLAALEGSYHVAGFKNLILLWENPATGLVEVVYGSGRIQEAEIWEAKRINDPDAFNRDLSSLPVCWALDFDLIKATFLRTADNRVNQLASVYDDGILIDHLRVLKDAEIDVSYLKFESYDRALTNDLAAIGDEKLDRIRDNIVQPLSIGTGDPHLVRRDALTGGPVSSNTLQLPNEGEEDIGIKGQVEIDQPGDIQFPNESTWGIPYLSLKYMAEAVPQIFVKWGEIGRKAKMEGYWHFFIEDVKFDRLFDDPRGPLYSGAQGCVEINYSVGPQTPRAWALWCTYKKRWTARYWQSKGLKIFADLNVSKLHQDINFLGIPVGWTAYASRGYTHLLDLNDREYELACERANGADVLYLVYGGGQKVQEHCEKRGWPWIPERMQVVTNEKFKGMDGLKAVVELDEFKDIKK